MRTGRIAIDELVDADGRSRHVKQLVALKHWARPMLKGALELRRGRLTFHVLEAPDAAEAIVDFARAHPRRPHRDGRARRVGAAAALRQRQLRRWWRRRPAR
jgi:hypothetical protein